MKITYYDTEYIDEAEVLGSLAQLKDYRALVRQIVTDADFSQLPSSLATPKDTQRLASLRQITEKLKYVKQVIVLGIGGSDLGTRAIHDALASGDFKQHQRLHGLNTASPEELSELLAQLETVKDPTDLAIFSISKSGNTAETVTNTAVLLSKLVERFGEAIYRQTVFIGNESSPLLKVGQELGAETIAMPDIIGGRYSVFTPVGLAPLSVLGYDIDRILNGVEALMEAEHEAAVAKSAAILHQYLLHKVRNVKCFAFNGRLKSVAEWWVQLTAESLGKATDNHGFKVKLGFIPSASTAVNMHSTEQLYCSGLEGVYTDFIVLDSCPAKESFLIPEGSPFSGQYSGKTIAEVSRAIQTGVLAAYEDSRLPYRLTKLGTDLEYELGLLLAARMLETMYLAHLLNINAFDQPNVELYKHKTRDILGI